MGDSIAQNSGFLGIFCYDKIAPGYVFQETSLEIQVDTIFLARLTFNAMECPGCECVYFSDILHWTGILVNFVRDSISYLVAFIAFISCTKVLL